MRRDFVSGVVWRAGGQIGRQAFTVVFGIVLARLLGPEAFGVITMATVFIGFVGLVDDLGIGAALIRAKDAEFGEVQRSTVFWFTLLLGSALALMCAALGLAVGLFYSEPQLPLVVALLSLGFPLKALALVQNVTLVRALRFKTLSRIDLVSVLVGGAVGVALAWRGAGLWSLVVQNLVTGAVNSLQHWFAVRFWPRLIFDRPSLRGLFRFGAYLVLSDLISFAGRNVDNVLIGRLFGSTPLALYARAYSFLYLELYGVRTVVSVLYPTLATMRDDLARAKSAFLRVAGVVTLITWPCACGLALLADPFVRTMFGDSWLGMIPMLRVLAPIAFWQALAGLQGLLFQVAGRTDLQLRAVTLANVICILGMAVGIPWGTLGVATGYAIASLLSALWTLRLALSLIGASLLDLLREVWGVALCLLPLVLGASAIYVLPPALPSWALLLVGTGAGSAGFLGATIALRPAPFRHVLDSLRALRTRSAAPPQTLDI